MNTPEVNTDPIPPISADFQLAQRQPYSVRETNDTAETGVFELYRRAEALVAKSGQVNTVNGVPSVTTPDCFTHIRVTLEGTLTTYIRLSKPQKDGEGIGFPAFIESPTPNFDEVETFTGNFSTLFFAFDETDGVKLCGIPDGSTKSDNPRLNHPDDVTLATEVLNFLQLPADQRGQLSASSLSNETRLAKFREALTKNARTDEDPHPNRRKILRNAIMGSIAAVTTVTLVILGVARSDHSTELNSQPDDAGNHASSNTLCNTNGVCVAGPGVPLESAPLAPGTVIARLPVDSAFAGAMGKIAIPGTATLNPDHIVRSQEGIYSYPYPQDTTPLPGEGDCTFIEGNFNQGISAAFTTSEAFAKHVRLQVEDESTLEICKVPGAPEEVQGNLYIARGTS